jgi:hypothetical protein
MAKRCTNDAEEIHHKRRSGGDGLDELPNAEALCEECHQNTSTHSEPMPKGQKSPPPFPQGVKDAAHERAGGQCECTRENCHD